MVSKTIIYIIFPLLESS